MARLRDSLCLDAMTGKVAKLVGWTVVAQALYVLVLPLLTRLYAVETFGHLVVIQSVSAFVIIVTGLRYEVAVLLPEDDETAANLVGVTALAILVSTSAVVVLGCVGGLSWVFSGKMGFLAALWWLIPLYQLGAGGNELLTNWAIRRSAYDAVARTKVAQVASQLTSQLGLGLLKVDPLGLFIGDVLGRVGGAFTLLRRVCAGDRHLIPHVTWPHMLAAAKQYRAFPLFSTWAALLGVASRQFPALVILALFGPLAAGAYGLASRVLAAPLELICRAYTQVYLAEGAKLARQDPRELRRLFVRSGRRLLILGTIPAAILLICGPWLFAVVFGPQWHEAGVYARALAIMLLANFVSFPLVHTLNILERQSWQLMWDATTLILGVGGIFVVHGAGLSGATAILVYSCAMAAMFAVHYVLSYVAISLRVQQAQAEAGA